MGQMLTVKHFFTTKFFILKKFLYVCNELVLF
jgi:hypothetical protein